MSAARTLGWPQVGLAAILDTRFGVTLNKAHQKADWARRPLTAEQIDYARHDTHYLVALRDLQAEALARRRPLGGSAGRVRATGATARRPGAGRSDPLAFWRVKGAYDLTPAQAAILHAVHAFREAEAARLDRPPFKVMDEAILLALAREAPGSLDDLRRVARMPPPHVQRYGRGLLQAVAFGQQATPLRPPVMSREPDEVRDRHDRLRAWRKQRAQARGVESDVILPKTTLRDLARRPPTTLTTSPTSPTSARGGARRTAPRSWPCWPPTPRRSDCAQRYGGSSLKGAYNGKFAAGAARVPMIAVHGVSMRYGSKVLFDDVTTTFSAGRRYGLTGPNGAGKSTFMKLLTGELQAQKGAVTRAAQARRAAPGPVRLRRVPRRRHRDHGQRPPVGGARGARPALRQGRHDRRGRHAPRRTRRHRR